MCEKIIDEIIDKEFKELIKRAPTSVVSALTSMHLALLLVFIHSDKPQVVRFALKLYIDSLKRLLREIVK